MVGVILWASSELVTKQSPPLLDTEVLQSFWNWSIGILVAMNLLALLLFVLNLSFPRWMESFKNWRAKPEPEEAKDETPQNLDDETAEAPLPPPPQAEPEMAAAPELAPNAEVLEEPVDQAPKDETQEMSEAFEEKTEILEEPTATESDSEGDRPEEEIEEEFVPPPVMQAESEPQTETEAQSETTPEPQEERKPEMKAEQESEEPKPAESTMGSSESQEKPEDANAKTDLYTKEEAPPLPEADESGETKEKTMKASSKKPQSLDELLDSPIEETEEIPIFDTSLIDQEIEGSEGKEKG